MNKKISFLFIPGDRKNDMYSVNSSFSELKNSQVIYLFTLAIKKNQITNTKENIFQRFNAINVS